MNIAGPGPRILVVGNALHETVTREDGAKRIHVGGVGGIMARELARAGSDVSLLCPVTEDQADNLRARLEEDGVNPILVASRTTERNPEVNITVRRGEPVHFQGTFPRPASIMGQLKNVISHYPIVVTGLYMNQADLDFIYRNNDSVVANATTHRLAPRLTRMKGIRAMTMNRAEAGAIMRATNTQNEKLLAQTLQPEYLLITRGATGRTMYHRGENPETAPAIPIPKGTDFIGAGDSLTAGLAYAIAQGLDPNPVMNEFLARLLKFNQEQYGEQYVQSA